ncbi:hypothetical protein An04g04900 [Aspergillus niger]|uniref:Uncharacterized protein n=2 Tax=Aspergillus niger TaxID=5061 RepID=A2QIV8_ASPNC|nr:hypothetical protein An04g04900 [Aspergillus niger]CAK38752.1 hypothetical protein An04g04900 [Aspergillus niger]
MGGAFEAPTSDFLKREDRSKAGTTKREGPVAAVAAGHEQVREQGPSATDGDVCVITDWVESDPRRIWRNKRTRQAERERIRPGVVYWGVATGRREGQGEQNGRESIKSGSKDAGGRMRQTLYPTRWDLFLLVHVVPRGPSRVESIRPRSLVPYQYLLLSTGLARGNLEGGSRGGERRRGGPQDAQYQYRYRQEGQKSRCNGLAASTQSGNLLDAHPRSSMAENQQSMGKSPFHFPLILPSFLPFWALLIIFFLIRRPLPVVSIDTRPSLMPPPLEGLPLVTRHSYLFSLFGGLPSALRILE